MGADTIVMSEQESSPFGHNETATLQPGDLSFTVPGTFGNFLNSSDFNQNDTLSGNFTAVMQGTAPYTLGTTYTIAIALGSAAVVVIVGVYKLYNAFFHSRSCNTVRLGII